MCDSHARPCTVACAPKRACITHRDIRRAHCVAARGLADRQGALRKGGLQWLRHLTAGPRAPFVRPHCVPFPRHSSLTGAFPAGGALSPPPSFSSSPFPLLALLLLASLLLALLLLPRCALSGLCVVQDSAELSGCHRLYCVVSTS